MATIMTDFGIFSDFNILRKKQNQIMETSKCQAYTKRGWKRLGLSAKGLGDVTKTDNLQNRSFLCA